MHTIGVWWMWVVFFVLITLVFIVDLFLLKGGRTHKVSTKESMIWAGIWISLSLLFNVFLWWYLNITWGSEIAYKKSLEFFTGYLIELSLSIDNLFVFILIFHYFHIPADKQRKLLMYGVLSAIILRFIVILLGIWLVEKFDWIFYVFGLLLLVSAIRMFFFDNDSLELENNLIMRVATKLFNVSQEKDTTRFMFKQNNIIYITPLFLALIFIELSDLIFAVDSIPAIFAITQDPFIVFTSNIFAILGLRSFYFLLANIKDRFYYLSHGLAIILIFVAIKMLGHNTFEIPISITLGVIVGVLIASIGLSWFKTHK